MTDQLELRLGVKTDPIEYRYSHPWLFRLLAEEGIQYVQLGTHFELYQLPDAFAKSRDTKQSRGGILSVTLRWERFWEPRASAPIPARSCAIEWAISRK